MSFVDEHLMSILNYLKKKLHLSITEFSNICLKENSNLYLISIKKIFCVYVFIYFKNDAIIIKYIV